MEIGSRFLDAHPRWVNAANLHLTLVFLGKTPRGAVPQLSRLLDHVAMQFEPFSVGLDGLSLFPPNSRNPKVLSAGINGDIKVLNQVYQALATALRREGLLVQDRPFRPHLTLARLPSIKTSSRLGSLAQSHSVMMKSKFPVSEIVLFESHLSAQGSRYESLHTAALGMPQT